MSLRPGEAPRRGGAGGRPGRRLWPATRAATRRRGRGESLGVRRRRRPRRRRGAPHGPWPGWPPRARDRHGQPPARGRRRPSGGARGRRRRAAGVAVSARARTPCGRAGRSVAAVPAPGRRREARGSRRRRAPRRPRGEAEASRIVRAAAVSDPRRRRSPEGAAERVARSPAGRRRGRDPDRASATVVGRPLGRRAGAKPGDGRRVDGRRPPGPPVRPAGARRPARVSAAARKRCRSPSR